MFIDLKMQNNTFAPRFHGHKTISHGYTNFAAEQPQKLLLQFKIRRALRRSQYFKLRPDCRNLFLRRGSIMANLTAKELSAIEDQLGIEQNLIKKYNMYAQTSQDAQIKTKCQQIATRHQGHVDTLMGHLN